MMSSCVFFNSSDRFGTEGRLIGVWHGECFPAPAGHINVFQGRFPAAHLIEFKRFGGGCCLFAALNDLYTSLSFVPLSLCGGLLVEKECW